MKSESKRSVKTEQDESKQCAAALACRAVARYVCMSNFERGPLLSGFGATAPKAFGTGGKGIRTPGLLIANETLYQLSYTPDNWTCRLCEESAINAKHENQQEDRFSWQPHRDRQPDFHRPRQNARRLPRPRPFAVGARWPVDFWL